MGTFILTFKSLIVSAGWETIGGDSTNPADIIAALDPVNPGDSGIHNDFITDGGPNTTPDVDFAGIPFGDCWYLDGSPIAISFAGLPAGFTPITAVLSAIIGGSWSGGTEGPIAGHIQWAGNNSFPESTGSAPGSFGVSLNLIPFSPSAFLLNTSSFGATINIHYGPGIPGTASLEILFLSITGTYTTQSFSYTLNTPDILPGEGDTITVTSPAAASPDDPDPLQLDHISAINVILADGTIVPVDITLVQPFWTPTYLYFLLPDILTSPVFTVEFVGDGTQFSGSITIGQLLTIFFTDGTGIYKLVVNKRNDTLYIQDLDPVQTVDVKIPTPFAKTGFLP